MKSGKIWGNTELIEHTPSFGFIELSSNQITVAVNIITELSGTDSMLSPVNLWFVRGQMVKDLMMHVQLSVIKPY